MRLFPLFADLSGRRVLVVGGGAVATRKAAALLEADARVTVGAPVFDAGLRALATDARVTLLPGCFTPDWLDDAWLVIAATDDRAVNAAVRDAGLARRLWVNVVDDPELSAFQVPAVVDRAPVVIAISSGGAAPVLARRMREQMEAQFDASIGPLAALAGRRREAIREAFPAMPARRAFYDALWDGEVAALLRAGQADAAEAAFQAALTQSRPPARGELVLLGTGPGGAGQLTLDGLRALNLADLVIHDPAVPDDILRLARRDAEREAVACVTPPGEAQWRAWLAAAAADGGCVVVAAPGEGPGLPAGGLAAVQALAGDAVGVRVVRGLA